jgi:hypothetical protein
MYKINHVLFKTFAVRVLSDIKIRGEAEYLYV